jgi:D-3-phosphoglycerate dehydrogenase
MHIVIPDDYQDAVRHLACFSKLAGHTVTIYTDTIKDLDGLAARLAPAEVLVLIRERTAITEAVALTASVTAALDALVIPW